MIFCSIRRVKPLEYPSPEGGFGPGASYPEVPCAQSGKINQVYHQVRLCMADAGLDRENFGKKEWNPLQAWVKPGDKVFLLCNFVQNRRLSQDEEDLFGKCTHASVIRAVCDYVLIALKGQGQVLIGNAPLQSTHWESVIQQTGTRSLIQFYEKQGCPVALRDLRMLIRARSILGVNRAGTIINHQEKCREVDFTPSSLLNDLPGNQEYRITDYDPSVTKEYQSRNAHRYLIHKDILDANVILSIPKLKTHEKVGITCGLKGFVGTVGRKECLAHHRFGGPQQGGDEYPGFNPLRLFQSQLHDYSHFSGGERLLQKLAMALDRNLTRLSSRMGTIYGGSWHGNETCWRMAIDVAKIIHFCDNQGKWRPQPQRHNLCFIDGIIAGEGNGPLSPKPVHANTLVFSSSVPLADLAACLLMGFDPQKIPLIRESFQHLPGFSSGLSEALQSAAFYNGVPTPLSRLKPVLGRSFEAPRGWKKYLNGSI